MKKTRNAASLPLALLMAVTTGPAPAAEPDQFISTGLLGVLPDAQRQSDFGWGGSLGYAHRAGERLWWEARAFSAVLESGVAGASDFYQYGLGLDLLWPLGNESGSHLLLIGGIGGVMNDVTPDTLDSTDGYANAGFGWRTAPWDDWGLRLRLDARYVYDAFDAGPAAGQGQGDFRFNVLLEIPPKRERVVEKVVEVEKIVVKEVIKEVPVERVVEKEVVREVQAPVADTDGDGISDPQDQCPGTLPGAKVEPDGCVRREQIVTLPNIEFEFASARLTEGGRTQLEPVVRFLQDQPEVTLDVWGHTDAQGLDAYNQKLSEQRAASVKNELLRAGIDAARLTSAGFGESQPVAPDTLEGRKRNRRVELRIRSGPKP